MALTNAELDYMRSVPSRLKSIEEQAVILYALENCEIKPFSGHPGGRNRILICYESPKGLPSLQAYEDALKAAEEFGRKYGA